MANQTSILKNIRLPLSLKEIAYQSIKEAILARKIKAGNVYNEGALAKELGISKTPVREALLSLASKGFLTFLPRKGFQINVLGEKDICDLFDFRMALEMAVIRIIAPKVNDELIEELEAVSSKGRKVINVNDSIGFLKLGKEFHLDLASLTQNQYIISSLQNCRDLIDWTCAPTLARRERFEEVMYEHGAIIERLRNRDVPGAVAAMEEHIRITRNKALLHMVKLNNSLNGRSAVNRGSSLLTRV